MITISQIYIFPIKSLAGISVESAELTSKGLKYDRRWLVVNENGFHVTQRTHPEMVFFKTSILKNGIRVRYKKEEIVVPFEPTTLNRVEVDVWGDKFHAKEVSTEISEWFTAKLGESVRLVFQPDDCFRAADSKYATSDTDEVSAADGYPVLIISEASLADLNVRLLQPVEMLRFRPNIVVQGLPAFGEDELGFVTGNDFSLLGVKNCGRCIMVTNDLKTAKLGKEPLHTLATFRKEGNKVLFGRNFIPQKLGKVAIGEELVSS